MPQSLTPQRTFRAVAVAETVTWTLLIAAMIIKYGLDGGDLPVRVAGSVHGFVFLSYAVTAVVVALNQRWSVPVTAVGVLSAIVPYMTVPFERTVERRGMLEGVWRTSTTDDPATTPSWAGCCGGCSSTRRSSQPCCSSW